MLAIFTLITNCTHSFSQGGHLRQTCVQARPVSDIHSAYGVRRCMAWIAPTNNMAEIVRQLCIGSREHVKNL